MAYTMLDVVLVINPAKMQWHIHVCIVRLWKMSISDSSQDATSVEMILCDQEGDNIHATVKPDFVGRHSQINILYATSVRPFIDDGKVDMYGFAFHSFNQILDPQFDNCYLVVFVDVIGKLAGLSEIEQCMVNGHTQRRIDISLIDVDMEYLECILWGRFAEDMVDFMGKYQVGPIIVIIWSCKTREFKGIVLADLVDLRGDCEWTYLAASIVLRNALPEDVVERIIGRQYLFKVKVLSDYVGGSSFSCRVIRMTDDRDVIDTYLASLNDGHDSSAHNLGGAVEE
ncbi:uncharacterized protein LOC114756519 [Neltuma alba]|uniref:uncharacterized protein LOC114756519 n=1 Tax=Neltuma alba TaxID=207710 RepID=UPI0010A42A17|nr:uncharacterized protein LOC114756519 [Prosopis alba]